MNRQADLLVIGSGPAGLAAACAGADCGLEVVLVDEQSTPGGQLFRNIESPLGQSMLNDKDRKLGMRLVDDFRKSGVEFHSGTTVWAVEPRKVSCTREGKSYRIYAQSVIVAPGAMERPVPFPGWTLPGVMGAGGADIVLKSGGSLTEDPNEPIVLAGNGPLLLLLACHLLNSGANIAAWLDTGYWPKRLFAAAPLLTSVFDMPYLGKGLGMALKILKSRVPMATRVTDIRAHGAKQLEKVTCKVKGKTREIKAGCLLRHEGLIPRTHILNSMGAKHLWDGLQRYWYPETDRFGATSIDGVFLAGDAAYVHGGDASIVKGTLSGIAAARRLGVISESEAAYRTQAPLASLRRIRTARNFLRYVFAPNPNIFNLPDETAVCRCESVTAGQIRKVVKEGVTDVNDVKRFTRCGMGPCQGRMCGPALAELTAATASKPVDSVGVLQVRQPLRPVTLENYCGLHKEAERQTA